MTLEEYTFGLGKLIVNLHSVEFMLRAFLWNREGRSSWTSLEGLREGDTAPENAFTNYDTLGQLIAKYNDVVAKSAPALRIDEGLVHLRDALAHGRVASNAPEPPLRLLKFARPVAGRVRVTHSVLVDEPWLSAQTTRVRLELEKVAEAEREFQAKAGGHAV